MKPLYRFRQVPQHEFPVRPNIQLSSSVDDWLKPKSRKEGMIDMLEPLDSHPLAVLSGKYNDEPIWDDFMEAIRQSRQKMEQQEDTVE